MTVEKVMTVVTVVEVVTVVTVLTAVIQETVSDQRKIAKKIFNKIFVAMKTKNCVKKKCDNNFVVKTFSYMTFFL